MNMCRDLTKKAFPFSCIAGISKRGQILTAHQLFAHVNNLILFLNYSMGTDDFQMYYFFLQYVEAIILDFFS
jgi:hypothetical protein